MNPHPLRFLGIDARLPVPRPGGEPVPRHRPNFDQTKRRPTALTADAAVGDGPVDARHRAAFGETKTFGSRVIYERYRRARDKSD